MAASDPALRSAALRAANAARLRSPDEPAARRDLAAQRIEFHIRRIVAAAPPLTSEQADRLRSLLPSSSRGGGGDDS